MKASANSVTIWALPLAVLAIACFVIAADPGGMASRVRAMQFDAFQRAKPRLFEDAAARTGHSVKILDADATSIARFGQWPWSRAVLAKLTHELKAAGAAVVVFDMPLDAPDPAASLAQTLPQTPQAALLQSQLAQLPSPDDALATALATVPAVTAFTLGTSGRAPTMKADLVFTGTAKPSGSIPEFTRAAGALPHLESASAGVGARNLPVGRDGEVRSVPMLFRLDGNSVPALDAEVLRLVSGDQNVEIGGAEQGLPGIDAQAVVTGAHAGPYNVPLRADGGLEIYFAGAQPDRHISAAALDQGGIAAGQLKGAIVFIGSPDATFATPLGPASRTEVHAEAMENMLLGSGLKPGSTPEAGLAFILIAGGGLVFLLARGRYLWAGALTVVAIAAAQGLGWFLFTNSQMMLDTANPSLALALAFFAGSAARGLEVGRTRTQLKSSFADSLPERTILAIAKNPSLLNLGGETRTITCLSGGIRRFAGIADSFADDPAGFTRLINTAMAPLIEDAISHGGMIARLDGEGFTACWNAPLDDTEHAIHACEAANRMTVTLAEVNEQLARERRLDGTAYDAIEIGIGISTGRAIAGGFTAHGRTIYTVTGDATVMADRIRTLSAQYGPAVVVSEDARKAAQRGFAFLEVDFIAAGPRDEPVKLYAMLGNPLVRASPKFRAMETFHEHIFQSLRLQQWDKARGLIDQCRKLSGASQKIYDLHLARIAYFEANPPGADWDGAFRPILK
ncbi:MAG TPA: adenylate/guanylate cyclase domain-containing protein [Rhizomicrobium sp.]|nr:adenylate/guanylate cyclase domain-containing protein [Rhizomicrobium sp.]